MLALIARTAELAPGAPVLEIGCGTGKLTGMLLSAGARVTGIEIDRSLAEGLRRDFGGEASFRLVEGDVLDLPLEDYLAPGRETVVIGNLPYGVSTEVLFRVLALRERVLRAVFLLQWEVGRRVCAPEGSRDYGILSVACQLWGGVRLVRRVPPSVFSPPPKVDSALVRWDLSPRCLYPARDPDFTMRVVRAAFGQRRKTLVNSLAGSGMAGKGQALEVITGMGLPPAVRAEQLPVARLVDLANRLMSPGPEPVEGAGPEPVEGETR